MSKDDISFLKQNYIVHRGQHDLSKKIPENSIKAFEEAKLAFYFFDLSITI